jgi:hypothetical protein
MKKLSLILLSVIISSVMLAQAPVISFDNSTYDFKKIKEQDGLATTVFKFKNTGNAPLVINRVQASCGCTTPTWTKEPVLSGKTGEITVSYNPLNRPGSFIKTISVFSNAGTAPTLLTIKGEVVPKPAVAR